MIGYLGYLYLVTIILGLWGDLIPSGREEAGAMNASVG